MVVLLSECGVALFVFVRYSLILRLDVMFDWFLLKYRPKSITYSIYDFNVNVVYTET